MLVRSGRYISEREHLFLMVLLTISSSDILPRARAGTTGNVFKRYCCSQGLDPGRTGGEMCAEGEACGGEMSGGGCLRRGDERSYLFRTREEGVVQKVRAYAGYLL